MKNINSVTNNISIQDLIDVIDSIDNLDVIEVKNMLIRKLSPSRSNVLKQDLSKNESLKMKNDLYIYEQCLPTFDDYFANIDK